MKKIKKKLQQAVFVLLMFGFQIKLKPAVKAEMRAHLTKLKGDLRNIRTTVLQQDLWAYGGPEATCLNIFRGKAKTLNLGEWWGMKDEDKGGLNLEGDSDMEKLTSFLEHLQLSDGEVEKLVGQPFYPNSVVGSLCPEDLNEFQNLSLREVRDSFLNCFGESISGVSRPWILLGVAGAVFGLHLEDALLSSANYLHEGSSKVGS